MAIAIGTLLHRHCKMISRGETSIEKHINTSERKKFSEKNEVDFLFFINNRKFYTVYLFT